MPDQYPRRTLAAIVAYLAGVLSAGVIAAAVFVTLQAATINATTYVSTTQMIVGQGTPVNKIVSNTLSVNPDSLGAGQSTTTNITMTGAAIGDSCQATVTAGDLLSPTSTAMIACRISSAGVGTITFYNATPTSAFNAGTSSLRVTSFGF